VAAIYRFRTAPLAGKAVARAAEQATLARAQRNNLLLPFMIYPSDVVR
jgi:hypothetical protein